MKRELAFALEVQSQLEETLGHTRSETLVEARSSSYLDEASRSGGCKRFKGCVVNGLIVYTRVRRSQINVYSGLDNQIRNNCNSAVKIEIPGSLEVGKGSRTEEVQIKTIGLDKSNCNPVSSVCEKESHGAVEKSADKEEGAEGSPLVMAEAREVEENLPGWGVKRFTRSSLKPKVEPEEGPSITITSVKDEVISGVVGETIETVNSLSTPKNKLELKMSKKIALNKRPMTVRELFDTGLLEGVRVIYMGVKKAHDYGLRGTIKDGGILCTCSSCNGCRVIPPSQFEIHACKQYKRAAQYICLENGKSLLDLLRACKGSRQTLEVTIQNLISSSPEEKYFTCRDCKGCFPSSIGQVGPLCSSCEESKRSQCTPSLATPPTSPINKKLRSTEPTTSKSPGSAPVHIPSRYKRKWEIKTKSKLSEYISISRSSKSAPLRVPSKYKSALKMRKKSLKPASMSKSSQSASKCSPSLAKNQWKITTKDQRLHKLVFEEDGLPDGTEVAYFARGQKLLQGYKKGSGILCCCCNCVVSPSQFEVHAGWSSRKKPYAYIYTSNGVSLHELAISLSKGRKYSAKDNDDLCIICLDGGNLLLCDGCPRAFHKECASLPSIPRGDWYCKFCQNMFQSEKFFEHNANAVAAGRVYGVDPIEQITKRCIRMVRNIEIDLSGCVLCRGSDFSKSGFGPRTIILCDQCEKEFHVGCLKDHKMAFLKELPKGKWFCSTDCTRIHSALQKLLIRGPEKLPDSLLEAVSRKLGKNSSDNKVDVDVSWRLISGKIASPETRLLLSEAIAIFHDRFDPIVDITSGRDLIPAMVYGRDVGGQEFGGMYCAILIVNSFVVSAAMLRVFGQDIAELPLVATSNGNHGKGYFQTLFSCIERLLAFLNVKCLVLPAAEEAESIWTEKFGFERIKPDQLSCYRRTCCQMVTFKGTSMLQKMVPSCRVAGAPL
ncbi:uncharacterized protein LOC111800114 isoform X2 [Cucurbita pepo subsp. pepo]|uniref:uncharacterized protein LOC111800114 isoform X2 n=1 Tax=Cucurbita pepo subsp. pepo TaxID=3664 RepID=UPI000C9D7B08|nr:uncharacterized protein LOC111800114 isoform X2 [Cucurbita pepo subsp. pepo]